VGYDPDATDYHDMRLLHERFGVPLPAPYAGTAMRRRGWIGWQAHEAKLAQHTRAAVPEGAPSLRPLLAIAAALECCFSG